MSRISRPLRGAAAAVLAAGLVSLVPIAPTHARPSPAPAAPEVATCRGVPATIVGTTFGDTLVGTPGRDVIVGRAGSDTIRSLGGDDLVCAGPGKDRISSGPGADVVHAGRNGCNEDYCATPDVIYAGGGDDLYDGGQGGRDVVSYLNAPGPVLARLAVEGEKGRGVVRDWGADVLVGIEGVGGSPHDDRIIGTPGPDLVELGESGSGGGMDVVRLGGGRDRVTATDPDPEADDIRSGTGDDRLEVAGGLVRAGPGNDWVSRQNPEGEAPLEVVAGAGHDIVGLDAGPMATVSLGPGDDRLRVSGVVAASGGTGDDEMLAGSADDDLAGGPGDDLLDGGGGDDTGDGGSHVVQDICRNLETQTGCEDSPDPAEPLLCEGEEATIIGTPYAEELTGTEGRDVIVARGGSDTVSALGGDDVVCAGGGFDTVLGGEGDDVLRGGMRADRLEGGPGDDDLVGRGNAWDRNRGDVLVPGPGDDRVESLPHPSGRSAYLSYAESATGVVVDLSAGTATGEGADTLIGFNDIGGSPFADEITGSPGRDNIVPGAGVDVVRALGGDDVVDFNDGADGGQIWGGDGDDSLKGGDGDDTIYGEAGDDVLFGGYDGVDLADGGPGDDRCTEFTEYRRCERE